MLSLRAAALTDIGKVRRENEDRFLLDEKLMAFGVADGVGGLPGGGEAAQRAVDSLLQSLAPIPLSQDPDLFRLVQRANESVVGLGRRMSPTMGIGTTLTLGCIRHGAFHLAHVGDSRAYVALDNALTRLTEDHSVENEARLRRARGEVVYYHEANRNALTRCIGQPTPPEVDTLARPLSAGERYLFCTDGVTRMLPDADLLALLLKHDAPQPAVEDIVGQAVRRGGPDNATAVVVFIDSP